VISVGQQRRAASPTYAVVNGLVISWPVRPRWSTVPLPHPPLLPVPHPPLLLHRKITNGV